MQSFFANKKWLFTFHQLRKFWCTAKQIHITVSISNDFHLEKKVFFSIHWHQSIFNLEQLLQGKCQSHCLALWFMCYNCVFVLYPVLINTHHSLCLERSQFNYHCSFEEWRFASALSNDQCVLTLVLQMMKFAWDNYKQYAWGKNELRPLTKNGHLGNMFGEFLQLSWWCKIQ